MLRNKQLKEANILMGIRALLFNCAGISETDRLYIVSNPSTSDLAEAIKIEAEKVCKNVKHDIIGEFTMHGQEPSNEVAYNMYHATIVFCITKMSMAHTIARLKANENKVKYFSLPDYSEEVLSSKALLADFQKIRNVSVRIADLLTSADSLRITTNNGTDLRMDLTNRKANPAPGFCYDNVLLASPPDAETNIAPNEFLTNGIAIIDGSIPCREIGLLDSPISLEIKNGYVGAITGRKSEMLAEMFDRQKDRKCRIVAEFGIGLNRFAQLKGSMLEDEGTLGTVHLGIGSNKTIGGQNEVPFHLDHVIREATVLVDKNPIMKDGVLIKELLDLLN